MHTTSLPLNHDLTIREFLSEKDAALVKFMDDASVIKAQRDALEALHSAALAQALRASEQTAAKEDKAREKELPVKVHISDVSPKINFASPSSMSLSNPDVLEPYSDDEAAARLLARDWGVASLQGALLQNPDIASAQHQLPVSSSPLPSSTDSSTTSMSSLSSSASAAARKTTASAPFAPTRVIPVTIPAEAFYSRSHRRRRGDSDSSSSSASSSNTVFVSSRPSTATTSPGPSSQKSSSPPTPTAVPTSPTKDWSNSSRPYTSASSVAAAHAQAQAATKFTSASKSIHDSVKARGSSAIPTSTPMTNNSAISVQGTSKRVYPETVRRRSISSSSERLHTAPSSVAKAHTSMLDALTIDIKNNASSSTSAIAALVTPTTSSHSSSASSRSSSVTSSPGISPSTSATSAASVPASSSHSVASANPVTVTSASKVAAEKEREREKERNKSRIVATITSKSTMTMTPSSSASAAAKRVSTSRPTPISVNTSGVSGDHSRKRSDAEQYGRNEVLGSGSQALSPTYVSATTLPSQTSRTTRGPEPLGISSSAFSSHHKRISISTTASTLASSCASAVVGKSTSASSSAASTPPRSLSPHTVRPRDAEELFSVPPIVLGGARSGGLGVASTNVLGGWHQQQQVRGGVVGGLKAVVPVSSLSESDDEDDGIEKKDQKEKEEDTRNEKETEEDNKNEKEAEEDNKNEKEEEDSSDEEEEDEKGKEEKEQEVGEELKQGFDVLGEEDVSFLGVYTAACSCSKCGESIVHSPHNPVCSPLFFWRSHILIRFCVSCQFTEKICFVICTSYHLSALLDSSLSWMCFSDDQVPEKLYRSREQYTLQHHP